MFSPWLGISIADRESEATDSLFPYRSLLLCSGGLIGSVLSVAKFMWKSQVFGAINNQNMVDKAISLDTVQSTLGFFQEPTFSNIPPLERNP